MHVYQDAKEMLHKELESIVKKGELSAGSLETVDKLLNSIKNACKIIMYDEYDEGGYSQAGASYAQHRDSRGRYSRDGGYSYDDGREEKVGILRDMMSEANSEDERRVLQKLIRRMENE